MKSSDFFSKSKTISLIIGLVVVMISLPGVVSAYSSSPNAQYISDTIPSIMNAGQTYTVSITMKNSGSMTWNEAGKIRLGGIGDGTGDAGKFGSTRIAIPAGTSVKPGAQYTFTFRMTAPLKAGSYTPKYRMVWEEHQWFGAQAPQPIQVQGQLSVSSGPSAQFTASTTQGSVPLSVQFTDLSKTSGSVLYKWDINNDGTTEYTTKNPSHTYLTPGTFTVKHTVSDSTGSTIETKTDYITVTPYGTKSSPTPVPTPTPQPTTKPVIPSSGAPKAQFTSTTTQGKSPLTVQFTDQSTGTGPLTYHWDFSDGEGKLPENSQQNPVWRFWGDGSSYTVTLTVTNAYGSDTIVKRNYITLGDTQKPAVTPTPTPTPTQKIVSGGAPQVQFTASTTQGKTPLTVQFTDLTGSTGTTLYKWDVNNDGKTDYTTKNPSHTYTAEGTYSVKLIVTNTYGTDTEIKTDYITVESSGTKVIPTPISPGSPIAQFTASSTQGKAPFTVQFTDLTGSTGSTLYKWDINNDGNVDYTTKNPSHTYQSTGAYTVKLTVSNAYGSDTEIKSNYITVSSSQPIIPVGTGSYGAESNPTGNPVGGGAGYTKIITGTDSRVKYTVSTKSELVSALKSAKSGEVVFVKGTAVIDMAGTPNTVIPAGVILASDRGNGGSQGALIKYSSNSNGQYLTSMFIVGGNNVRITGLRLQGESLPQDGTGNGEASFLSAIKEQNKAGLEVDNCEIWGWAWAGVLAMDSTGTSVHHNYIHHNQARGEGYGAEIAGGDMLIEANIFNYNRHDISAAGRPGESYEARYNLVRGDGHPIGSHHFDVHACNPNNYNDDSETSPAFIAGNVYKIHHNTFEAGPQAPIGIRSRPVSGAYIYNNVFMSDSIDSEDGVPVWQRAYTFGNMFVTNNYWKGKLYTGDDIVWYYHP